MPDGCDEADGRTLREAAEWLARQRVGRLDESAFARWRDQSPAHALAFCRVVAMWRTGIDASVAPSPRERHPFRRPSRRDMLRAGGLAGIGAVLATGIAVAPAYAWHSARTGVGESRRVMLPDGSGAELNTDSRLAWRFSSHERTFWFERGEICLTLRGGAAATIRGGPSPIVLSPGRFNLRLHSDAVEVLVLDGHAHVDRGAVQPGSVAATAAGAHAMLVSRHDMIVRPADPGQIATMLAWRDHALLFQDVPLGSAVADYNRYLLRKIVIVDPDLAATPIGGRFETDDPTAFLKAIAVSLGVHVTATDRAYLLTRDTSHQSNNPV